MVGDQGDAQGPDGVPPSGGVMDHGDDEKIWVWQRMGVSRGRGGDGLCRDPPHQSIHKEAEDNHIREGGLTACLCIFHGGREDVGDEPDGAMVVSRHSK